MGEHHEWYGHRFAFPGGRIEKVVFDLADDAYVDVEAELAAAMARDWFRLIEQTPHGENLWGA